MNFVTSLNEPSLSSTVQNKINKTSLSLKKSLNFELKSSQQKKLFSMHTKKSEIKIENFTNDIENNSGEKSSNFILLNSESEERKVILSLNLELNDSLVESEEKKFFEIPNNKIDKNIEIQNVSNDIKLNKNMTVTTSTLPLGSLTVQMGGKNPKNNREIDPNHALRRINIDASKIEKKELTITEKKQKINDMKKGKNKFTNSSTSKNLEVPDLLKNKSGEGTEIASVRTKQSGDPRKSLTANIYRENEKLQCGDLNDSKNHLNEMTRNATFDAAIHEKHDIGVSVSASTSVSVIISDSVGGNSNGDSDSSVTDDSSSDDDNDDDEDNDDDGKDDNDIDDKNEDDGNSDSNNKNDSINNDDISDKSESLNNANTRVEASLDCNFSSKRPKIQENIVKDQFEQNKVIQWIFVVYSKIILFVSFFIFLHIYFSHIFICVITSHD